jgi:hypothetical protein
MKGASLFLFYLLFALFSLKAQEETTKSRNHSIGLSSTFIGNANVIYYHKRDGGAGYEGKGFYTVALNYIYSFNRTLAVETGIEYGKYSLIIIPNIPPPDIGIAPYPATFELLNIPVSLRTNFAKYFFVNGGVQFDFDIINSYYDHVGMGGVLGLGFNYTFQFKLSLFANPYVKAHNLINFSEYRSEMHLMEVGIRLGIMYSF